MQNANMIMSIFVFYGQKKGIPSENPFLFRKELSIILSPSERLAIKSGPLNIADAQ